MTNNLEFKSNKATSMSRPTSKPCDRWEERPTIWDPSVELGHQGEVRGMSGLCIWQWQCRLHPVSEDAQDQDHDHDHDTSPVQKTNMSGRVCSGPCGVCCGWQPERHMTDCPWRSLCLQVYQPDELRTETWSVAARVRLALHLHVGSLTTFVASKVIWCCSLWPALT